jgi:HAD superfamily hydrolase (TIGR01490 family)
MHNQRIAIFDFDETIVKVQSADKFVDFIRSESDLLSPKILEIIRKFLIRFKFFHYLNKIIKNNNYHKRLKLYQIRGITKNEINLFAKKYYEDELKDSLILDVIHQLEIKKKEGFRIILLSGGYSSYIKFFAKDFSIDENDVIATDIEINSENKCTGFIKGIDCMGVNKILKLKNMLGGFKDFNLEKSFAYSDCQTDLPILKLVGNGFVVQNKFQKWIKENGLKLILWE